MNLEIPNKIFQQMLGQTEAETPIATCGILADKTGRRKTNADKLAAVVSPDTGERYLNMELSY